jgi:hypothetical protein
MGSSMDLQINLMETQAKDICLKIINSMAT